MTNKKYTVTLDQLAQNLTITQTTTFSWKPSTVFQGDMEYEFLKEHRIGLYERLGSRRNASMDLIDALTCQTGAQSVTDLSEQDQFVRQYASVRDAIHYSSHELTRLNQYLMEQGLLATPDLCINGINCKVLAVDSTPTPHAHAQCLADRTFVHDASNQVTGKPINIGHEYSTVVGVTEEACWVCPLQLERIPSTESPASFGMRQAIRVCEQSANPVIVLLDSHYNTADCRITARASPSSPIAIVRSQCNRRYYLPAAPKPKPTRKPGRQKCYGERINFCELTQGPSPDVAIKIVPEDEKGCLIALFWQTTYTKIKGMNGYEDPSALLVIYEFRADGTLKYQRPMVLRVFVPEQYSFFPASLGACLYPFRFSIEHFFSAKKKHLLFGRFQSPEVQHQECFSLMGSLAYQQWYFAKMGGPVEWLMKPWHRYPKFQPKGEKLIPSHVQKGYSGVLRKIGTPSTYCPPNNVPAGRSTGEKPERRAKQPVILKKKDKLRKATTEKSNAPSMDSATKRSALEIVSQTIERVTQRTAAAAGMLIVAIFFLLPGFFNNSVIYTQKSISASFELKALNSYGEVIASKTHQKDITQVHTGRSPPEKWLT